MEKSGKGEKERERGFVNMDPCSKGGVLQCALLMYCFEVCFVLLFLSLAFKLHVLSISLSLLYSPFSTLHSSLLSLLFYSPSHFFKKMQFKEGYLQAM